MITRFILILLLLFLATADSAAISQATEWKGAVEYKNGITVIKNPGEPQYGEIYLEFTEDLIIEDKDAENYFFQWLVDIDVDRMGNIFVLDKQQYKVFIFDKEGHYLKALGGKGQGPGEFMSPKSIIADGENRFHVLEDRRLHKFDDKTEFIRTINFRNFTIACSLYANDSILALVHEMNTEGLIQRIDILNPEGKKAKTIAENSIAMDKLKNSNPSTGLGPMLFLSPLDREKSIYWNSSEYKLFLVDSSGTIAQIIEKNEPSQKEFYLRRVLACNDGQIFVERWKSEPGKKSVPYFDVFANNGHYIFKAYTGGISAGILKSGYFFALDRDSETGAQSVRRYAIKNWDLLKKGA